MLSVKWKWNETRKNNLPVAQETLTSLGPFFVGFCCQSCLPVVPVPVSSNLLFRCRFNSFGLSRRLIIVSISKNCINKMEIKNELRDEKKTYQRPFRKLGRHYGLDIMAGDNYAENEIVRCCCWRWSCRPCRVYYYSLSHLSHGTWITWWTRPRFQQSRVACIVDFGYQHDLSSYSHQCHHYLPHLLSTIEFF
jgi:hypothetical protein